MTQIIAMLHTYHHLIKCFVTSSVAVEHSQWNSNYFTCMYYLKLQKYCVMVCMQHVQGLSIYI
jgi:hypothetical protein